MPETLADFLAWPFVWRAVVAGLLIALCAALLGVTLVLRRLSFMGDGLSHVAFGAMAVAGAAGLAGGGLALALPLTALAAVILLRGGRKGRGDASLAMLSVGAMATGYLLMNVFPSSSNVSGDVCSTLFGAVSLLTLTNAETWLCAGLSVAVIAFHLLTYHRNFDIAFDADFARASGVNTSLYGLCSAVVTAVVIVVSMRLVGALLVSALLVFPAVLAMRLCRSFRAVTLAAAAFAVAFSLSGILVAVVAGTPVGATIVVVEALALLAQRLTRRGWLAIPCVLCLVLGAAATFSRPASGTGLKTQGAGTGVVATVFPLYDWTRTILGEHTNTVSLTLLQRRGGDLHSYQPTAEDIRALAACDLFLYVGGASDDWVPSVLAANARPTRRAVPLLPRLAPRDACLGAACDHAHPHHDHDDDHGGEHHHDHAAPDEHIWLSLRDARACVAVIADALAALDPAHAGDYRARAAHYADELHDLDAAYAQTLAPGTTLLFADRFPFARMADDYGWRCIAAFRGCCAEAEATFGTVAHLAHEVDEHGLDRIFVLEDGDRRLAEAVRTATKTRNQRILSLDSLQRTPDPSASYLGVLRRNLQTLTAPR